MTAPSLLRPPMWQADADTEAHARADAAAPARDEPQFLQLHRPNGASLKAELRAGLLREQAEVSPKFLYDELGSKLFEAITQVPEYYPTRTEAAIFAAHGVEIAQAIGTGSTLVDLGAGNCAKAAALFGVLQPRRYVAVDISVEFLRLALTGLQRQHPQIDMLGVGLDFSRSLALPAEARIGRTVFFYPGSSIGNFSPVEALRLLGSLHRAGGPLLIGIDLLKPREVLEPAYDDALGVTAAFNLNLLLNLNRLLEADFDLRQWRHRSVFNEQQARVEMHLQAREDLLVRWSGGERRFLQGEHLHTENSHKHTPQGFADVLRQAGYRHVRHWCDPLQHFAVFLADH